LCLKPMLEPWTFAPAFHATTEMPARRIHATPQRDACMRTTQNRAMTEMPARQAIHVRRGCALAARR